VIGSAALERDLVIVGCAVSAGVHAALAPAHLEEGAGAAAGFAAPAVLLAWLCFALTRRVGAPALAGAVLLLSALLVGYALAVTSGLPLVHPHPEPVDGLAVVTKVVELVGLLAAVNLLRRRLASAAFAVRPIPVALTALIACFSGLTALAVTNGHGMHVDHDQARVESSP
jgi:hypothetical protein